MGKEGEFEPKALSGTEFGVGESGIPDRIGWDSGELSEGKRLAVRNYG